MVIGIDVSQDRLDVIERPEPVAPGVVTLEATGGYETIVAASLATAGLPVVVVRAFARALGKRAQTDPLYASMIAHFVESTKPAVRPLLDADTERLADLVARRRQIIDMMVAERQRQPWLTEKRLQRSITRLLAALQQELSAAETDIAMPCAARRPGGRRRICSPAFRDKVVAAGKPKLVASLDATIADAKR